LWLSLMFADAWTPEAALKRGGAAVSCGLWTVGMS